jgi:hypothetical protein
MVKATLERVVGLTDLEQEIEAEFQKEPPVREPRPVNFAPPRVRAPALSMPDYVEHREGPRRSASCRRKPLSANTKLRRKTSRRWARN